MKLIEKMAEEYAREWAHPPGSYPFRCVKEHFLAGVEHARPKWISVKTRLPEAVGDYWVYRIPRQYAEGVMAGQWAYASAPMTTRHWDGDRWQSAQEITHWMPLPKRPEAERDE